jgi:multidrug transporter EmrE-like cation transporter
MIRYYILLGVACVLNAVANTLMKAGMRNAPQGAGVEVMIKHYLTSWPVIVGIVLFGLNILAYTQALTKIPLSIAYPIMTSLGIVIVVSASFLFLKESITWIQMAGFVLIIGGLVCVTA